MEGGLSDLDGHTEESLGAVSGRFARGVLLSARGNSGVILSQIFAGINEELAVHECADAVQLARAYRRGVAKSYASVQNPTEGTILTVFRESTEYVESHLSPEASVEDFYRLHIEEARRSLAATKEKLSVLAEADVVDSGAAGYLAIAEGMYRALCGESLPYEVTASHAQERVDIDRFTRDSVLEFGYCTEVLLRLTTAKVDPDAFAIDTVIATLQELEGESVVAYKQEDVVKVHVHTHTPGEVLLRLQAFGEFLTVKIENMSLQHTESEDIAQPVQKSEEVDLTPSKKYGIVTVSNGPGVEQLFRDLGSDEVIFGGQTNNPSTSDFLDAFEKINAENIFVFPNNSNIFMAAQQAGDLYEKAHIHIVPSKSIGTGYVALSCINLELESTEAILAELSEVLDRVIAAYISPSIRDADISGIHINNGDTIGIIGKEIVVSEPDRMSAAKKLASYLLSMPEKFMLTVFNGADSFVCVGAGLLVLALCLEIRNEKKALASADNGEVDAQ
jgi:DAK2 domain fusion protein YloV